MGKPEEPASEQALVADSGTDRLNGIGFEYPLICETNLLHQLSQAMVADLRIALQFDDL